MSSESAHYLFDESTNWDFCEMFTGQFDVKAKTQIEFSMDVCSCNRISCTEVELEL